MANLCKFSFRSSSSDDSVRCSPGLSGKLSRGRKPLCVRRRHIVWPWRPPRLRSGERVLTSFSIQRMFGLGPLLSLNFLIFGGRRVFEVGDELLKFGVGVELLQIGFAHQVISFFKPVVDRLTERLQRVIGVVGRRCHAGEVIPYSKASQCPWILPCLSITSLNSFLASA